MNDKPPKPNEDDGINPEFIKALAAALAKVTPGKTDPAYRYAEALLKLFTQYSEPKQAQGMLFDCAAVYEIITGKYITIQWLTVALRPSL